MTAPRVAAHRPGLRSRSVHDATDRAAGYLADANEAAERGDKRKAERLYAKAQYWQDAMNRRMGNGDGVAS